MNIPTRDQIIGDIIANSPALADSILKQLQAQTEAGVLLGAGADLPGFVASEPTMTQDQIDQQTTQLATDTSTEKIVLKAIGVAIQVAVMAAKASAA